MQKTETNRKEAEKYSNSGKRSKMNSVPLLRISRFSKRSRLVIGPTWVWVNLPQTPGEIKLFESTLNFHIFCPSLNRTPW